MDEFEGNQGLWLGFSIAQSLWLLYDADAHSNGILTSGQMQYWHWTLCNATAKEQDFKTKATLTSPPAKPAQLRGSAWGWISSTVYNQYDLRPVGMDNVRNIWFTSCRYWCGWMIVRGLVRNLGTWSPITARQSRAQQPARKFNIAVAGGRDNSVHAQINDLGFIPPIKNDTPGLMSSDTAQSVCSSNLLSCWIHPAMFSP